MFSYSVEILVVQSVFKAKKTLRALGHVLATPRGFVELVAVATTPNWHQCGMLESGDSCEHS
jgi:hypothetical protein